MICKEKFKEFMATVFDRFWVGILQNRIYEVTTLQEIATEFGDEYCADICNFIREAFWKHSKDMFLERVGLPLRIAFEELIKAEVHQKLETGFHREELVVRLVSSNPYIRERAQEEWRKLNA